MTTQETGRQETQQDMEIRVVALRNLEAMCARQSGVCHRYWVERHTETRVRVGYSNPSEYGTEHPMYAEYPCYRSGWRGDKDNPRVILELTRVIHDSWSGEGWQAFDVLTSCPELFRDENGTWATRQEIEARV